MLKRQESSLSSSRRQAASSTPTPSESHHAATVGCMSAIFQLFSKYQNSNKRLTFGRKQGKRKPSSPTKGKCSSAKDEKAETEIFYTKELNCDVKPPRSPALRPEIRRSQTVSSPEESRASSSLLMRLIGLEDFGTAAANRPASEEDSVTEKRKQLLQALEKCNEDLEALKRIINAVQKSEIHLQPPHPMERIARRLSGDGNSILPELKPDAEKFVEVVAEDQNIPANTAEELTGSPFSSRSSSVQNDTAVAEFATPQHHKPTAAAKKPGEEDEPITKFLINKHCYSMEPTLPLEPMRPQRSSSKAMVESVEEVCREIGWGEKREIGIIGLVLQDHLCRELIQELVHDLTKACSVHQYSLPLEACKRRLCF